MTVINRATIAKSFGAATVPLNGTTSLTLSLVNPGNTAVYSSTNVAISGNGTYNSIAGTEFGSNTAITAGTYHWLAIYSGDGNNNGTNSGCASEPVTIGNVSPSLTTTASTGNLGGQLTDTATLSGGFNPTGTISFYLFAPGVTCSTSDQSGAVYSSAGITVSTGNPLIGR